MRMLLAPDSFKGTYSAAEVAAAIAEGMGQADVCPVADGGEGTLDAIRDAAALRTVRARAHDPLGREIVAEYGASANGQVAVVETAAAAGLDLIGPHERDAEAASTSGVGELIATAIDRGAGRVIVTVGGSATTDGGTGAIEAIEARGGLRGAELTVICDVNTKFLMAAEVYAPQKGASPDTVARLTDRLTRLAEALPRDPREVPMTGAAGGLSGGLWARYGAKLVPGAAWVLDFLNFDDRLSRASAVVTGEGRLDTQTFEGKLVGEVARRARAADKPVHAVVGSSELSEAQAVELGLASVTIASDLPALRAAGERLSAGRLA
ncbi:MAG: glycerate kinase [Actinobacteria bacterium]|nr:glycerate kinase [Actinomycetota bacterium]